MKRKFKKGLSFLVSVALVFNVLFLSTPYVFAAYENTHVNTGDQRTDIIEVAKTQIGNGTGSKYTFGAGNVAWCAYFISWCARQAGIDSSIIKTTGWADADSFGVQYYSKGNYTPQKGDIIIYDFSPYDTSQPASAYGDHVGLVEYVEDGRVHTIEGNSGSNYIVKRQNYSLSYSEIKGYGVPNYNSNVTHIIDTRYPTNFQCYPKNKTSNTTVYNSDYSVASGHYISPEDYCTIIEVYTDGFCKVNYPVSSGTATRYAYISDFDYNLYVDLGADFYAHIMNTDSWLHVTNNNGNVTANTASDKSDQVWHFTRLSNGSYKIISVKDNNCMEVHNFESANGTNVEMHSYDDNSAQHWFISGESACYIFRAECGSNVLDVNGASNVSGTNVQMWESNNTVAQKFQIWKLDFPNLGTTNISSSSYSGNNGENVKLTWNSCQNATGYDIRIYDENKSKMLYAYWNVQGTSLTLKLPAGKYKSDVATLNSKFNTYKFGSLCSFEVYEKPSYTRIYTSSSWYDLTDTVSITVDTVNSTHQYVGIDKVGVGRVLAEKCGTTFTVPAKQLGAGTYTAFFSVCNGTEYIKTEQVTFVIVEKPGYTNIYTSSYWYDLSDTVSITVDTIYAKFQYIGIDKVGVGRVLTSKSDNTFTVSASQLGVGTYSAYFSVYNGSVFIDTKRVTFTIAEPVDLGSSFYAKILNAPKKTTISQTTSDNVVLYSEPSPLTAEYLWDFTRQSDGSYKIKNQSSDKYLTVYNKSTASGANVIVSDSNSDDSQLWYIYGTENNYTLRAKNTDCVLDLTSNASANGTNIQMLLKNDTDSQKFAIEKFEVESPKNIVVTTDYTSAKGVNINISWDKCNNATAYYVCIKHDQRNCIPYRRITDYVSEKFPDNSCSINLSLEKDIYKNKIYVLVYATNKNLNISRSTRRSYAIDKNPFDDLTLADLGTDFYANIGTLSGTTATNSTGNVIASNDTQTADQIWHFEKQNDGSYKIISSKDKKALTANNTNIETSTYVNSASQHWYIYENPEGNSNLGYQTSLYENAGTYILRSASGVTALCLPDDSSNVKMAEFDKSSQNQKFIVATYRKPTLVSPEIEISKYAGLNGDNVKISWNKCDNATGYNIKIMCIAMNLANSENKTLNLRKAPEVPPAIDLYNYNFNNVKDTTLTLNLPAGDYDIEVCAVNNVFDVKSPKSLKYLTVQSSSPLSDANLDGKIDIDDVIQIQEYLLNMTEFTDEQKMLADINEDGEVNLLDAYQAWTLCNS